MANNIISSLQLGSGDVSVFTIPYGECSTAAATAAKTVTVQGDFVLEKGAVVAVKFTNSNSVASPTLNVTPQGGTATGAISIMRYGTTAISTSILSSWAAGQIVIFMYDGTYWQRTFNDTNSTYSNASLGQGYAACSTAAGTAAKTASISSYALTTGGIVVIKFNNGITVANPTLNISSKGAKKIFYKGAALTDTTLVKANDVVSMIYDGTQYQMFAIEKDTDTNTDTKVTQSKLADGITVATQILTTSPGRTDTATEQAYFHSSFGYIDSTNTITANATGLACEDGKFNISKAGVPSGTDATAKQGWRDYMNIYVQDTEPTADAPVGAIWIDTSVSSITYAEGVSF